MAEKNYEEMSDEEFAQEAPPEIEGSDTQEPEEVNNIDESSGSEENIEEGQEPSNEEDSQEQSTEEDQAPEIDYKGFYEQVMSPIKANGKNFQARSPEEAIKLMQMGVNYTHKMQSIAPYRKKIQMLQNAGLLEDEKLNYLIDLSKGNKDAIGKLLKDSRIDPLDLNVSEESKYIPSNHSVSDAEVQIQTLMDDLQSTPEGIETLNMVRGLDQASLDSIWKTPSLMSTLHEQRQNGVYKLITDEMEHQKLMGNIPEGTSFLDAYKAVGDMLIQQKYAMAQKQQQLANLPQGTLHKPTNSTSAQIKSAAPSGKSKKSASHFVDPFSLSDEEFDKQFKDYAY